MTLEQVYRRLLICYPREHRLRYEEEMLGVLLDDAAPNQRMPSTSEVLDLLGGAVRAHLRQVGARLSADAWRAAAAFLGLLAPLLLCAHSARLPVLHLTLLAAGYPQGLGEAGSRLPWILSVAWLAVAVLVACGQRRVAVALAVTGAALQAVEATDGYVQGFTVFDLWPAVLAVMGAVALAVPVSRAGPAVLAGWRVGLLSVAAVVTAAAPSMATLVPDDRWAPLRGTLLFTVGVGRVEALLLCAGYGTFAVVVLSTPSVVRRRLLALIVPVAITMMLTRAEFATATVFRHSTSEGAAGPLSFPQWLSLALVPPLSFAVATAVVHRREGPQRRLEQDLPPAPPEHHTRPEH
ncbi:hypothetical protein [Micromonospora chersina]|uniref:hypothetical protein n=1 Tax=Micromonospora chersina TaxID=47854 RepID=UPI0033FDCD21